MAFQQSAVFRHAPQQPKSRSQESSSIRQNLYPTIEQSQEWVLFSPSQADSSTDRARTSRTAGLSHASDLGSLNTAARSGQLESLALEEEDVTEDGDLDSLDDGLHAFREPTLYHTTSNNIPVLPAHDGLGTFPASSPLVLEQLWKHEQHNSKRKHEGYHRRPSSIQRTLETVDEMEAQANEEKRIRIEKWRMEQSQALIDEVERATRQELKRHAKQQGTSTDEGALGTTPTQAGYLSEASEPTENEPFWRRVTRRFIRDIIGIDEPLLSVLLGETLPGEATPRSPSPINLSTIPEVAKDQAEEKWQERLLQRIARELGVFASESPRHPGAFTTYPSALQPADYAGIPIRAKSTRQGKTVSSQTARPEVFASNITPVFSPTMQDSTHASNWGLEEELTTSSSNTGFNALGNKEYWEKDLDINSIVQYLKDRFMTNEAEGADQPFKDKNDASASRAAIIRQYHPLIARMTRPSVRTRRDSRLTNRRPGSSCASESAKSAHLAAIKSGSSRNYWDIGGSVGSGSVLASGGRMGGWGEV